MKPLPNKLYQSLNKKKSLLLAETKNTKLTNLFSITGKK